MLLQEGATEDFIKHHQQIYNKTSDLMRNVSKKNQAILPYADSGFTTASSDRHIASSFLSKNDSFHSLGRIGRHHGYFQGAEKTFHVYNPRSMEFEPHKVTDEEHHDIVDSREENNMGRSFTSYMPERIKNHVEELPLPPLAKRHLELIHHTNLPRTHQNSILQNYTDDSAGINDNLLLNRKDFPEHIKRMFKDKADNISSLIKNTKPLDKPLDVYSGMGKRWKMHKDADVVETPAFISSTLNPKTSFEHAKIRKPADQREPYTRHIAHFALPKGYNKGMYITDHSTFPEELEHLLDKGQKWKYNKQTSKQISEDGDTLIFHHLHPLD